MKAEAAIEPDPLPSAEAFLPAGQVEELKLTNARLQGALDYAKEINREYLSRIEDVLKECAEHHRVESKSIHHNIHSGGGNK